MQSAPPGFLRLALHPGLGPGPPPARADRVRARIGFLLARLGE